MLTPFSRTPFDLTRLASLFDGVIPETGVPTPAGAQRPALDLTRTDAGYELRVDLPGVNEEDVELSVHDDLVTLRAQRKTYVESDEEGPRPLRVERTQSVFERRLRLPQPVDAEGVEAHLAQGVLSVSLPLASHATPRRVPVLARPSDTSEV